MLVCERETERVCVCVYVCVKKRDSVCVNLRLNCVVNVAWFRIQDFALGFRYKD